MISCELFVGLPGLDPHCGCLCSCCYGGGGGGGGGGLLPPPSRLHWYLTRSARMSATAREARLILPLVLPLTIVLHVPSVDCRAEALDPAKEHACKWRRTQNTEQTNPTLKRRHTDFPTPAHFSTRSLLPTGRRQGLPEKLLKCWARFHCRSHRIASPLPQDVPHLRDPVRGTAAVAVLPGRRLVQPQRPGPAYAPFACRARLPLCYRRRECHLSHTATAAWGRSCRGAVGDRRDRRRHLKGCNRQLPDLPPLLPIPPHDVNNDRDMYSVACE